MNPTELFFLGRPPQSEATVPMRVQVAMSFVNIMRQTSVRPPEFEGLAPREVAQSGKEREAYFAALDCLRLYFADEMFIGRGVDASPDRPGDEPPTAGVTNPNPTQPTAPASPREPAVAY